jgi:uncharacterized membrane protein
MMAWVEGATDLKTCRGEPKGSILGLVAVMLGAALGLTAPARARADGGWRIDDFDTRLEIANNGAVDVTETIAARFYEPKHGIFREIPVRYAVFGHLYDLRARLKSVHDDAGHGLNYTTRDDANKLVIRIGDAGRTLTGNQTYQIRYRVARAVLWEGEHAVLRWNATGTEWLVPIGRTSVTVVLPEPLDDAHVQYDAWTGAFGASQKNFKKSRVDSRTLQFQAGPLKEREGMTVEVAIPASSVKRPSMLAEFGWWLGDNFPYALIPTGLAACISAWYFRGRDLPGRGTVVVGYEPPKNLGPAEVGTLSDERVDLRDISSILIDLAVRGYLTIEEVKTEGMLWRTSTDYVLHARKDADGLKNYEKLAYKGVFSNGKSVKLSSLQNKFYARLDGIKRELYGCLTEQGYFDGNPRSVQGIFFVLGFFLAAADVILAAVVQFVLIGRVFGLPIVVTALALVVILGMTAWVMPRRTRKGRIAWEEIRGLEEYIRRAEVDDLKEQERRNVFERLLPYATTFGLTTRWASAFKGMYTQPPDWYQPAYPNQFSMDSFGWSLNNSVQAMSATFPSQPRSEGSSGWSSGGFGGGGSSGGGFGGGGGGSW